MKGQYGIEIFGCASVTKGLCGLKNIHLILQNIILI